MQRKFKHRDYQSGEVEMVTCEYCPKADWWNGQTSDGQRVYFEPNGEQAL